MKPAPFPWQQEIIGAVNIWLRRYRARERTTRIRRQALAWHRARWTDVEKACQTLTKASHTYVPVMVDREAIAAHLTAVLTILEASYDQWTARRYRHPRGRPPAPLDLHATCRNVAKRQGVTLRQIATYLVREVGPRLPAQTRDLFFTTYATEADTITHLTDRLLRRK